MEGIVKLLDENLKYVKHEVTGDKITIRSKLFEKEANCPQLCTMHAQLQRYPVVESIINLVNEFKRMLESENVEKVEELREKASSLKIRTIDKFVNGLKRDMQAVRNTIYIFIHRKISRGF